MAYEDPSNIRNIQIKVMVNAHQMKRLENKLRVRRKQKGTYLYELLMQDLGIEAETVPEMKCG